LCLPILEDYTYNVKLKTCLVVHGTIGPSFFKRQMDRVGGLDGLGVGGKLFGLALVLKDA
jgi:hypothetical protein